jgi:hypothetical protein
MDDLLGFSLLDYPDEYYYCNETELTNLNVGLECARDILSNSIQGNLDGTLKLILFVVARSEYTPCNEDLISRAKRENCNIHTVGLGVIDESELNKELIKIAGDKYNLTGDKLKYHYSAGSSIWNNAAVSDAIDAALGQYYKENLSNNIVVVDTFYPYLQYVNGTINATINGAKCAKTERYTKNQDETTMLEIALDKELCMKPGDIIEIVFDTSLNLSLPIDVVGPGRVDDYFINYSTSTSYIGYKWLGNDRLYKIPLPECVLSTEMGRI